MKNLLIKKSSMIYIGILVLCLMPFFIFSDSRSTYYLVDFVSTENKSVEIFQLDHQKTISQYPSLSAPTNSLEAKQELTPIPPLYPQTLDAYLKDFSSELMMAVDLQEKFDKDVVDPAAATAAEKDLAYVFYQGMEWQEFVPQDISCKKHICRLILVVESPEKKSQLLNLISEQLMTGSMSFYYAIPVSLPIEKQELIYFIRVDAFAASSGVLP